MTKNEIEFAIAFSKPMKWKDPDPIDGNDYRISKFVYIREEMSMIHYNGGMSEAEVFNREIEKL